MRFGRSFFRWWLRLEGNWKLDMAVEMPCAPCRRGEGPVASGESAWNEAASNIWHDVVNTKMVAKGRRYESETRGGAVKTERIDAHGLGSRRWENAEGERLRAESVGKGLRPARQRLSTLLSLLAPNTSSLLHLRLSLQPELQYDRHPRYIFAWSW